MGVASEQQEAVGKERLGERGVTAAEGGALGGNRLLEERRRLLRPRLPRWVDECRPLDPTHRKSDDPIGRNFNVEAENRPVVDAVVDLDDGRVRRQRIDLEDQRELDPAADRRLRIHIENVASRARVRNEE